MILMHTLDDMIRTGPMVTGHSVQLVMFLSSMMWWGYKVLLNAVNSSLFHFVHEVKKYECDWLAMFITIDIRSNG